MEGISSFLRRNSCGRQHVSISNGAMKTHGYLKGHSKDSSGKKEEREESGDSQ